MASFIPSRFPAPKAKEKARRYTPEEWEQQKANVERLYVTENRPLREVINTLEQQFDFTASEKQLKSKLTKLDLDVKNLKGDTVLEIARTKAKRAAIDNKKSSFRVNKKPVDDRKIDRFMQRNEIFEDQLLGMASPVNVSSPGFSVFTPQSPRSRVASRSPTPSLNFRTLSLADPQPHGNAQLAMIPEEANIIEGGTSTNSPVGQQLSGAYTGNAIATSSFERTKPSLDWLTSREMALQEITRPVFGASNDDAGKSQPSFGDTGTMELENSGIDHVPRISTPPVRPLPTGEADAATRHSVSQNRLQTYQAKRDYSYARQRLDRVEGYVFGLLWSCDFCGKDGGMTTFIDHCPQCAHLRCPMCPVDVKLRSELDVSLALRDNYDQVWLPLWL